MLRSSWRKLGSFVFTRASSSLFSLLPIACNRICSSAFLLPKSDPVSQLRWQIIHTLPDDYCQNIYQRNVLGSNLNWVLGFSFRGTASFSSVSTSEHNKEILVRHLLVKEDDQKLLLELQKRANEGVNLSDLALEYSICPSKKQGGSLGWVKRGQMVPEFEDAAFRAPLNKVVTCKTKHGWHLLQVLSERESVLGHIHPSELHQKMQDPSFLEEAQLIDVREPHEVAKASLPGFKVLPLQQIDEWGPEITTTFDPKKDTYVMCRSGKRSLQAARWLQNQGFSRVFNVSGGIHEYATRVDPSIPTY